MGETFCRKVLADGEFMSESFHPAVPGWLKRRFKSADRMVPKPPFKDFKFPWNTPGVSVGVFHGKNLKFLKRV